MSNVIKSDGQASQREQTARILKQVLPMMAKHCMSLDPAAYALWFEYELAPADSPLRKTVDEIVKRGLVISSAQARALARMHCSIFKITTTQGAGLDHKEGEALVRADAASSPSDGDEAVNARTAVLDAPPQVLDEVEKMLATLIDETSAMRGQNKAYGDALEVATRGLVPGFEMIAAKDDLRTLRSMTQQMGERCAALEQTLAKSQADMRVLRAEADNAKHAAMHDALTGLPNRRAFDEYLSDLLVRVAKTSSLSEIGLMIVDLDNFKATNDLFGHPFGDKVLKSVGALLANKLPPNTYAARLGGEEFAVVVCKTGFDQFQAMAEQLRALLASGRIRRGEATEDGHCVTASIGLALLQEPGESMSSLIERADKALYRAKRSGKNRCVLEQAGDFALGPATSDRRVQMVTH